MTFDPGKYDDLCTHVREETKADGVLVVIWGGEKGNGLSWDGNMFITLAMPDLLETLAKIIRHDMRKAARNVPPETSIDMLELSPRTRNCLINDDCRTIGDVIKHTKNELLCIPNFGRKALNEIEEQLANNGYRLRLPGDDP
jgi:hypothetical protein